MTDLRCRAPPQTDAAVDAVLDAPTDGHSRVDFCAHLAHPSRSPRPAELDPLDAPG
jgi:hypothetical protein